MQFLMGADFASTRSDVKQERISRKWSKRRRLPNSPSSEFGKRQNPFIDEEEKEAKSKRLCISGMQGKVGLKKKQMKKGSKDNDIDEISCVYSPHDYWCTLAYDTLYIVNVHSIYYNIWLWLQMNILFILLKTSTASLFYYVCMHVHVLHYCMKKEMLHYSMNYMNHLDSWLPSECKFFRTLILTHFNGSNHMIYDDLVT